MPYSQTHLLSVHALLAADATRRAFPWLQEDATRAAFLLGAIAPDTRVFSNQPRESTHFFGIPPLGPRPEAVMLDAYPAFASAAALDRPHAAFIAGYLTHLVMDYVWVEQVVMPCLYVEGLPWGARHPNWPHYCLVMAYLEVRASQQLDRPTGALMALAEPQAWLPFINDADLITWRDYIADLIWNKGTRDILAHQAQQLGVSPEALARTIEDDDRFTETVHGKVTLAHLEAFRLDTARRSASVVLAYLNG
ncbi:MAG: hypothetical protein IT326_00885 [Anaerolineae bacterium]|nr:hypothetical protein [Anaerolineae bacterium]